MNNILRKIKEMISRQAGLFWDFFNRLSKREKNIFVAATLALSVLVVDYGVVEPLRRSIENLKNKILDEEKKVAYNMRVAAQAPEVDALYRRLLETREFAAGEDNETIRSSMLHDRGGHTLSVGERESEREKERRGTRWAFLGDKLSWNCPTACYIRVVLLLSNALCAHGERFHQRDQRRPLPRRVVTSPRVEHVQIRYQRIAAQSVSREYSDHLVQHRDALSYARRCRGTGKRSQLCL